MKLTILAAIWSGTQPAGKFQDIADSDLDWTAVRPPRLTDKPVTGTYRTAYDQNIRRGIFVSRADVAHYMLRALDQPETFRRTVGIAG